MEIKCPICKGTDISYVLFGYPSEGMWEAEAGGHFKLGGCMPKDEKWFCNDCDKFIYIKSKMPCAFCTNCNSFPAPEHVEIIENQEQEEWKCLNCNTIIKKK